jgi:hypothetical protein
MVQCGISTIHEFMAIEEDRNEDRFGIIHTTSVLMWLGLVLEKLSPYLHL